MLFLRYIKSIILYSIYLYNQYRYRPRPRRPEPFMMVKDLHDDISLQYLSGVLHRYRPRRPEAFMVVKDLHDHTSLQYLSGVLYRYRPRRPEAFMVVKDLHDHTSLQYLSGVLHRYRPRRPELFVRRMPLCRLPGQYMFHPTKQHQHKPVVLQNKAVRAIHTAANNSHTDELFKNTKILKLEDMNSFN